MPDFEGDFETHLTVASAHDAARLQAWAAAEGVKYSRIVLDRGQTTDQPMLTLVGRGTLGDQRVTAAAYVRRLRAAGFPVVRIKVEASPFNDGVPLTTVDSAAVAPECYFEHHVKLVLDGDDQVARVRGLSEAHAAHVSRNARRGLAQGRHERFVTQRCRGVGRTEAHERLAQLLTALSEAGFAAVEVEREFVVVDDNPELDRGWIDG